MSDNSDDFVMFVAEGGDVMATEKSVVAQSSNKDERNPKLGAFYM